MLASVIEHWLGIQSQSNLPLLEATALICLQCKTMHFYRQAIAIRQQSGASSFIIIGTLVVPRLIHGARADTRSKSVTPQNRKLFILPRLALPASEIKVSQFTTIRHT
jgi:hypothetical protein